MRRITAPERAALALLATVAALFSGSAAVATAPRISVVLLSPASGSVVPRFAASPLFRWQITTTSSKPLHGSGRLEISMDPSFSQALVKRFDCGYSPGDCPGQAQWGDQPPYWYDLANSCSDVPAVGNCGTVSRTIYWRVRYQPVGGRSWSSPVGILRRAPPVDMTPPTVQAVAGSADYGSVARVFFFLNEDSGVSRDVVQLYDGSDVVFGMRTQWVTASGYHETYLDLPLQDSIKPGVYRWCLTVVDQGENRVTDCAPYTIN